MNQQQPVAAEALSALGGPPDKPHRIDPLCRFAACEAHTCPYNRDALVLTPTGGVVAIGLLGGVMQDDETRP